MGLKFFLRRLLRIGADQEVHRARNQTRDLVNQIDWYEMDRIAKRYLSEQYDVDDLK